MSDYEETRPGEATPRRAGTEKTTGQASIPNSYSTTIPRRRQVASFLRVGKEHAIKREDLAALTGMGERALAEAEGQTMMEGWK